MKDKENLISEISRLTARIETDYPGLYQFLDENPVTLPVSPHPEMDAKILENYLNDLKAMVKHYLESQKIENSRDLA